MFQPAEAWALVAGLQNLLAHGGVPHREALVQVADKVAAVLPPAPGDPHLPHRPDPLPSALGGPSRTRQRSNPVYGFGVFRGSARRFAPPPDVSVLNPYAYRLPSGSVPPNVRLRCNTAAQRILSSRPEWARHMGADGSVVRWVPPDDFPFIARFLLGCGPGVIVEEPPALRDLVVELAEAAIAAHREKSVT